MAATRRLLFTLACYSYSYGLPLLLLVPVRAENCSGNPSWGNCTSGNIGFRHPLYDTISALSVDEDGARIVIDANLGDWAEHPDENRYTDVEFAAKDGTIVVHEEPYSNGTWSGPSDYSLTTMLKWDSSWLYIAVQQRDDKFEPIVDGDECWANGLQMAIEVGGKDAVDIDGRSSLGLVQAKRSFDTAQSRLVLMNVGLSANSRTCSCEDCPHTTRTPVDGCCTSYESHGPASPSGTGFEQRMKVAIRRDEDSKQTIYELAIHRDDLMYPDWPGRNPTALSRWHAGTRFGFSLLLWEGEELDQETGSQGPAAHSYGGYYPHAIVFGWNKGYKEPWKAGSVLLQGDEKVDAARVCVPLELSQPIDQAKDAIVTFDLTEQLVPKSSSIEDRSIFKLAGKVVQHPQFGNLRQLQGTLGKAVNPELTKTAVIVVQSGTAEFCGWSSHNSTCNSMCCYPEGHLQFGRPGSQEAEGCSGLCEECPRSFYMVSGEPDAPPGERGTNAALAASWVPGCSDCGLQWVWVQSTKDLYLTKLQIHEAGRVGAIHRVDLVYEASEPFTVWQRNTATEPPEAYTSGTVFSVPLLCDGNPIPYKISYVRIWVDSSSHPDGPPAIDAVHVEGLSEAPVDHVFVVGDRVAISYNPIPGIHVSSDAGESFQVMPVGRCTNATSVEPIDVKVPSTRPLSSRHGTFWGDPIQVPILPFQRSRAGVEMDAFLVELHSLLGHIYGSISDVRMSLDPSTDENTVFFGDDGEIITLEDELVQVTQSNGKFWLDVEMRSPKESVRLWIATSAGLTFRLLVQLESTCRDELPVISYKRQECLPLDDDGNSTESFYITIIVGAVAVVAVFLLALGCWMVQRGTWRLPHSYGPPKQGQNVTLVVTDIQGSTTLWDSFPDKVSVGISLHHHILRSRLKVNHGYEITTEGDSFKCAFHTPEDAICWSVMVQLDLLTAPWPPELEAGGEKNQVGKVCWADSTAGDWDPAMKERVDSVLADISEQLDNTLPNGRREASSMAKLLFNADEASQTEFSRKWADSRGPSQCLYHKSSASPLPLFRGLRVRIGIHTGVAEHVSIHENTKRYVYGGKVAEVVKAVSEIPSGGQIVMSGETLAALSSIQSLGDMIEAERCAGWRRGSSANRPCCFPGVAVMHLGAHAITGEAPDTFDDGNGQGVHAAGKWSGGSHVSNKMLVSTVMPTPTHSYTSNGSDTADVHATGKWSGGSTNRKFESSTMPAPTPNNTGNGSDTADVHATGKWSGGSTNRKFESLTMPTPTPNSTGNGSEVRPSVRSVTMSALDMLKVWGSQRGLRESDPDCGCGFRSASSRAWESRPVLQTEVQRHADQLANATELVMVLPTVLLERAKCLARCFPNPPDSALTPAWHQAPSKKGVTILFTFVEGLATMKSLATKADGWITREVVTEAVLQYQSVVRWALTKHGGYEAEGEEGNFVCAFKFASAAISFALELQEQLLLVNWSQELLDLTIEQQTLEGATVFRGLRAGVGMCSGDALRAHPSLRTGRQEFFGPLMNHAARVARSAHGGQVLLHEATCKQLAHELRDSPQAAGLLGSDMLFHSKGTHKLKGIRMPTEITEATNARLRGRVFPAMLVKGRPSIDIVAHKPVMRGKSMFKLPSLGRNTVHSSPNSRTKSKANDSRMSHVSVDLNDEV